jgi:hypothetical protein
MWIELQRLNFFWILHKKVPAVAGAFFAFLQAFLKAGVDKCAFF